MTSQDSEIQSIEVSKSQLIRRILMILGIILGIFFAGVTFYTVFYYTPPANCPHVLSQCNPPQVSYFHRPPSTRCRKCL